MQHEQDGKRHMVIRSIYGVACFSSSSFDSRCRLGGGNETCTRDKCFKPCMCTHSNRSSTRGRIVSAKGAA